MLTWESYFERWAELHVQFELAEAAIDGWAHSQEALDKYAKDQLEDLRTIFREGAKTEAWVFVDESRINDYLGHVRRNAPQKIGGVKTRMTQYEYILNVAVFESFMKSVHRQILHADPTLLRPKRPVELRELVSLGADAVIGKEIEREVQSLDRESAQRKADYFRQRLRINWSDRKIVPILESVIELRNVILHEDPNQVVRDLDRRALTMVCTGIPFATVAGAAILYPAACSLPKGMEEADARIFVLDRH